MRFIIIIPILCLFIQPGIAYPIKKPSKETLYLRSREAGMFSIFQDVIACLHAYDKKVIKGLVVDFETTGLYYDPSRGENWWNYYFEPLVLGDLTQPIRYTSGLNNFNIKLFDPYHQHNKIISKYIVLKPHIAKTIDEFVSTHFSGKHVLGIHYRGTDKITEAPRVTYERMFAEIKKSLKKMKIQKYCLFVATDEKPFLDEIIKRFQGHVCYRKVTRSNSNQPLHLDPNRNPYECGEASIIDCLLLSKTSLLIRTASNLSECSRYFNPDLPVIIVGEN